MEIIKCMGPKAKEVICFFWIVYAIAQAKDIIGWWWTSQAPNPNSHP